MKAADQAWSLSSRKGKSILPERLGVQWKMRSKLQKDVDTINKLRIEEIDLAVQIRKWYTD